jgi:hypothetical protein
MIIFRGHLVSFKMPIAAAVPIIVAKIDAVLAIMNVFWMAFSVSPSANRVLYQCKVNPDHTALLFEALKEKAMRVPMGKYKNKNTMQIYIFENVFFIVITSYFVIVNLIFARLKRRDLFFCFAIVKKINNCHAEKN